MSNITLYLPAEIKDQMESHSEIRWSEIARHAVIEKLKELKKLELLRKYIEKEPFSDEDLEWMEENDWHPVDEKQMDFSFVDVVEKRKEKMIKAKSVDELFE